MAEFKVVKKVTHTADYVTLIEANSKEDVERILEEDKNAPVKLFAWKTSGESNGIKVTIKKLKDKVAD